MANLFRLKSINLKDAAHGPLAEMEVLLEIEKAIIVLRVTGELDLFKKELKRLVLVLGTDDAVQEVVAWRDKCN